MKKLFVFLLTLSALNLFSQSSLYEITTGTRCDKVSTYQVDQIVKVVENRTKSYVIFQNGDRLDACHLFSDLYTDIGFGFLRVTDISSGQLTLVNRNRVVEIRESSGKAFIRMFGLSGSSSAGSSLLVEDSYASVMAQYSGTGTGTVDWNTDLTNIPPDIADGDDNDFFRDSTVVDGTNIISYQNGLPIATTALPLSAGAELKIATGALTTTNGVSLVASDYYIEFQNGDTFSALDEYSNVMSEARAPIASDGIDGMYFINSANGDWHGPKSVGAWPASTVNVFSSPVIDNLTSTSATDALSANMGRALLDSIQLRPIAEHLEQVGLAAAIGTAAPAGIKTGHDPLTADQLYVDNNGDWQLVPPAEQRVFVFADDAAYAAGQATWVPADDDHIVIFKATAVQGRQANVAYRWDEGDLIPLDTETKYIHAPSTAVSAADIEKPTRAEIGNWNDVVAAADRNVFIYYTGDDVDNIDNATHIYYTNNSSEYIEVKSPSLSGLLPQGNLTIGGTTTTPVNEATATGVTPTGFRGMNTEGITITPITDIDLTSITFELLDNTAPGTATTLSILQGNGVGSPLFATSTDAQTVPFSTTVTSPVTWTGFAGVTLQAGVTYTCITTTAPNTMFFRFFGGPGHPIFGVSLPVGGGTTQSPSSLTGTTELPSSPVPDITQAAALVNNHVYRLNGLPTEGAEGTSIGITGNLYNGDHVYYSETEAAWLRLAPEVTENAPVDITATVATPLETNTHYVVNLTANSTASLEQTPGVWNFHNPSQSNKNFSLTIDNGATATFTDVSGSQQTGSFVVNSEVPFWILNTDGSENYLVSVPFVASSSSPFVSGGDWDPSTNTPDLNVATNRQNANGELYIYNIAGTNGAVDLGNGSTTYEVTGEIKFFSPTSFRYDPPNVTIGYGTTAEKVALGVVPSNTPFFDTDLNKLQSYGAASDVFNVVKGVADLPELTNWNVPANFGISGLNFKITTSLTDVGDNPTVSIPEGISTSLYIIGLQVNTVTGLTTTNTLGGAFTVLNTGGTLSLVSEEADRRFIIANTNWETLSYLDLTTIQTGTVAGITSTDVSTIFTTSVGGNIWKDVNTETIDLSQAQVEDKTDTNYGRVNGEVLKQSYDKFSTRTIFINGTTGSNDNDGSSSGTAWSDWTNVKEGVNYKIHITDNTPLPDHTFRNQNVSLLAGVVGGAGTFPVLGNITCINSKLNANGDLASDTNQRLTFSSITAEYNSEVVIGNMTTINPTSTGVDALRIGRNSKLFINYETTISGQCNRALMAFSNGQIVIRTTVPVNFTGTALNRYAQAAVNSIIYLGSVTHSVAVAPNVEHLTVVNDGVIKRTPTTNNLSDDYATTTASSGGEFIGWADSGTDNSAFDNASPWTVSTAYKVGDIVTQNRLSDNELVFFAWSDAINNLGLDTDGTSGAVWDAAEESRWNEVARSTEKADKLLTDIVPGGLNPKFLGGIASEVALTALPFASLTDGIAFSFQDKTYVWHVGVTAAESATLNVLEPVDKPNIGVDDGFWVVQGSAEEGLRKTPVADLTALAAVVAADGMHQTVLDDGTGTRAEYVFYDGRTPTGSDVADGAASGAWVLQTLTTADKRDLIFTGTTIGNNSSQNLSTLTWQEVKDTYESITVSYLFSPNVYTNTFLTEDFVDGSLVQASFNQTTSYQLNSLNLSDGQFTVSFSGGGTATSLKIYGNKNQKEVIRPEDIVVTQQVIGTALVEERGIFKEIHDDVVGSTTGVVTFPDGGFGSVPKIQATAETNGHTINIRNVTATSFTYDQWDVEDVQQGGNFTYFAKGLK